MDEVTGKHGERLAILVEGEPEEDGDAEHGKQRIETLFDLLSHSLLLFGGVFHHFGLLFLGRLREFVLVGQEDDQGDGHCQHRSDEGEVHTLVEHGDVVGAESGRVGEVVTALKHALHRLRELLGLLTVGEELVAEAGHIGIIDQVVGFEPPFAEERGDERGKEAADVDEDVEDLETGVAAILGLSESLGALLGGLSLKLVVQFADDSLEVAFEQTVTEGNEQQGHTGDDEDGRPASATVKDSTFGRLAEQGDSHHHIADSHNDETPLDGLVVVLGSVGDDTTHQTQHIDAEVEDGVDDAGGAVGQTELGDEEEQQHGVHNIVAEALAHIAQSGGNQPFRVMQSGLTHIINQKRYDNNRTDNAN